MASAVVTDDDPRALDALVTGAPLLRLTGSARDHAASLPDEGWARPTECADAAALLAELVRIAAGGFARRDVTVPPRRSAARRGGGAQVRAPPAGPQASLTTISVSESHSSRGR
ncbi:hypothetical protein [Nocardioides sp. B-3]|uniref:hypothetical protein n=1 Tax=Nocardioides sp. B-3 TaxID=2895565 RepID=UPI002152D612|nr:hypothetical protein [Nocardioides sp. B-3]UUZ60019.1 hypothetical protein LP418_03105 [Nocardioides sp. B-3]